MTLTQLLDRMKELDEKATARPWRESIWVGSLEHPDGFKASILAHGPIHIYKEEGNAAAIRDSELITELRNALPAIRKVIRIQRDALKYYANSSTYQWTYDVEAPDITEDRGERAREAIADCEQVIQEGMK